jgi:hypothetical protein
MKIMPNDRRGWLSLASAPFKAYVVFAAFIYPYLRSHFPVWLGFGGQGTMTEECKTHLSLGYFASFCALVMVAYYQRSFGDRRGAIWSFVFSLGAFYAGVKLFTLF